jgi:hypothetical protein
LRCVVDHRAPTTLEAILARGFRTIDRHGGLRAEETSYGEQLSLGGPLEGERICVLRLDTRQFRTASVAVRCPGNQVAREDEGRKRR